MIDRFRMLPSYHYENNSDGVLTKSVGKSLRDYRIEGNSVQDGTPSPENPVEIESCGEKTANLCKKISLNNRGCTSEIYGNGFKATTSINTGGYTNYIYFNALTDFEWGKTYTFSCHITMSNADMSSVFRVGYINNTTGGWHDFNLSVVVNNDINVITVTLPDEQPDTFGYKENSYGTNSVIMWFNIQRNALEEYGSIIVTDIMINEGETAAEYEPYGYKVPVTVSGKNLFDASKAIYGGNNIDFYLPAGVYTISLKRDFGSSIWLRKGQVSSGYILSMPVGTDRATFAFDTDEYLRISHFAAGRSVYDIILVSGSYTNETMPSYEPYFEPKTYNIYLDEPLRKIGDYADYVDFKNGKVVRNINKITFDGTEVWQNAYGVSLFGLDGVIENFLKSTIKISSHYIYNSVQNQLDKTMTGGEFAYQDHYRMLYFKDTRFTTTDSWAIWLSEQYNNGTPITVYHISAVTTETEIDLPEILTHKGTNIISIGTELQPSSIKYQYYKGGK